MRAHSKVLASIVQAQGWATGAEIGVFKGATLFHLLDTVPGLDMIGVDQWLNFDRMHYTRFDMPAIGCVVRERAVGYGRRCTILHMDRLAASEHVEDGTLDFVFIDALHEYEPFKADLSAWGPKVRPGGCITGHDHHWASVRQVLDETLPGWVEHDASVWTWDVPDDAGSE